MKWKKIAMVGLIFSLVACLTLPLLCDNFVDRVADATAPTRL